MKNGTKHGRITAAICTAAGLCLMILALAFIWFQIKEVSGMKSQTNTHPIQLPFDTIDIQTVEAAVAILPAEDGVCRVECRETDKITHTVAVEGSRLTIRQRDTRRWFDWFGSFSLSVTVYLPEAEYHTLTASTVSGHIEISDALHFGNTALSTTSGRITSGAQITGDLVATSVSGNVTLSNQTGGQLTVETTSGRLTLSNVQAASITARTTSGGIHMTDTVAAGKLEAHSVSGKLSLTRADAADISLSTVSGSVTASLRTGKIFSHSTVSGSVSLPPDTAGGTCHISTTSGSIRVTVEETA